MKICRCSCHREDSHIIHFMPCCDLCYYPYLTKEGKLRVWIYMQARGGFWKTVWYLLKRPPKVGTFEKTVVPPLPPAGTISTDRICQIQPMGPSSGVVFYFDQKYGPKKKS